MNKILTEILSGIKKFIIFFLVLVMIMKIINFYTEGNNADFIKNNTIIKFNEDIAINTLNFNLKNIIVDREKIIWDYDGWYYTKNNSLLLYKSIVVNDNLSEIEDLLDSMNWTYKKELKNRLWVNLYLYSTFIDNFWDKYFIKKIFIFNNNHLIEFNFIWENKNILEEDINKFIGMIHIDNTELDKIIDDLPEVIE